MRRACYQLVLWTHSFQAPGFYERLDYKCEASIEGYPKRHANVLYLKRLARGAGDSNGDFETAQGEMTMRPSD